ncbi:MAG: hypothetical protein Q4D76_05825 [Oscillospiraceae bacterium]|nr:hypothetical protein [Oscillospiraceae bacterium]
MELLLQKLQIPYKKIDDGATENTYVITFPSKYSKKNKAAITLSDSNEFSVYGNVPIKISSENQPKLLRALNQLNLEVPSFVAYIEIDEDDKSEELAFRSVHQLYGDISRGLVKSIALIKSLEEYIDMYIEKVALALK